MEVVKCYRKDCENIVCNRYSENYGYVCDDCFDEMVVKDMGPNIFMNTSNDDKIYDRLYYEDEFEMLD